MPLVRDIYAAIVSRSGKMPAHAERLGNDKVHLLAAYVYSLSQKAPQQ